MVLEHWEQARAFLVFLSFNFKDAMEYPQLRGGLDLGLHQVTRFYELAKEETINKPFKSLFFIINGIYIFKILPRLKPVLILNL